MIEKRHFSFDKEVPFSIIGVHYFVTLPELKQQILQSSLDIRVAKTVAGRK